jgi:PII-like signaling protein
MEGFGTHSRIHTAKILRLSEDLPIVIEIVDVREKIDTFLALIDYTVVQGLVTIEKVQIHLYRSRKHKNKNFSVLCA